MAKIGRSNATAKNNDPGESHLRGFTLDDSRHAACRARYAEFDTTGRPGVRKMLPAACGVIIFAFAVAQVHAEQRPSVPRCQVVNIPDVMGIRKCLNETLNLCGLTKDERKAASRVLGKCLVASLATKNFLTIVLGLVRAGLRFALRITFPGSTAVVYPFWTRVKNLFTRRKKAVPNTIMFTSRPCNDTVPVSFPDFLGIAECVHLEHFMCSETGKMDIGSTVVTSALSMVVCILKKLPFFNILRLIKDVVCNFLALMVKVFERTRALKFMVPITELFQIILSCRVSSALPVPVERMLLSDNII
ncbi:uncharacterized protein LOC144101166 isoform X1 [Amblyomma americanum]